MKTELKINFYSLENAHQCLHAVEQELAHTGWLQKSKPLIITKSY